MFNLKINNIVALDDNKQVFEIESISPEIENILTALSEGLKFDLPDTDFDIFISYYEKDSKKMIEIKSI